MKTEQCKMVASYLDKLVMTAERHAIVLDEQTRDLTVALFKVLWELEVCGDDEMRQLWLSLPRGTIEDFGDFEEYLECGDVSSREEFEELWHLYYPQPVKWYKLTAVFWNGWYSVGLDNELVLRV